MPFTSFLPMLNYVFGTLFLALLVLFAIGFVLVCGKAIWEATEPRPKPQLPPRNARSNRPVVIAWLIFLAVGFLAILVGKAPAQQTPLHIPPAEFDKPYTGKLTVETVTPEQLRTQCTNATLSSLGCSWRKPDSCRIILVNDAAMKAAGWTRELMLRHEVAHCNGWPQSHAGKRPYP